MTKKKNERITAHLQEAGFRAPQTVLWLQKVQCFASTFVLKGPPIENLRNVSCNRARQTNITLQQTNNMDEETLKAIAGQLRQPTGEYAIQVGEKMNEGNLHINLTLLKLLI